MLVENVNQFLVVVLEEVSDNGMVVEDVCEVGVKGRRVGGRIHIEL